MDAVGSTDLYLRALTLEHLEDELELELWGIGLGLLLGHALPFLFGEKIAPPGAETLALGVVRIYGRRISYPVSKEASASNRNRSYH